MKRDKVPATVNEKIFSLKKPSAEKEQKETKDSDNVFQNAKRRQKKRRRVQSAVQDKAIKTTTVPLVDYPDTAAAATVIASISASTPTEETTDIPATDIAPETSPTPSTEVMLPLQSGTPATTEPAILAEKAEVNELPLATDPALEANPAPSPAPKSSWFTSLKNECNRVSGIIGSSIISALRFEKAHQANDKVVQTYQSVGSNLIAKLSSAKDKLAKRSTPEQSATTPSTTEQAVSTVPGSCCANDSNSVAPLLFTNKNTPAASTTDKEAMTTPEVAPTAAKTLTV